MCCGGCCNAPPDPLSEPKDLLFHNVGAPGRKRPAANPLQELPQLKKAASLKITPLPGASCIQYLIDMAS